jgi:hypothetical protein
VSDIFETLAAIEHERWADWQRYVHGLCVQGQIPQQHYDRWERQISTPYDQLSEQEKESDRDQVRRYWHLISPSREWISVDDRLPDRGMEVLVTWLSPHTDTWQYMVDDACPNGTFMSDGVGPRITHWMPLPEPPK